MSIMKFCYTPDPSANILWLCFLLIQFNTYTSRYVYVLNVFVVLMFVHCKILILLFKEPCNNVYCKWKYLHNT